MIQIIPAILEKDLSGITARLASVLGEATLVQIDVVDGTFAPNRTWPFSGPEQDDELDAIVAGTRTLPFTNDFDFQFDLMVEDALKEALRFATLGTSALIVHASSPGAREALEALQERRAGDFPVKLGVALSPAVSADALEEFSGLYDFVQAMGIAKPGFQGEPFDPRALELVGALRRKYPRLTIQVDGGVGREHLAAIARAGADRAAEGSVIFAAPDPKAALRELFSIPT